MPNSLDKAFYASARDGDDRQGNGAGARKLTGPFRLGGGLLVKFEVGALTATLATAQEYWLLALSGPCDGTEHGAGCRRFPGITDNTKARACARSIAGWMPLPAQPRPVTRPRPRKDA